MTRDVRVENPSDSNTLARQLDFERHMQHTFFSALDVVVQTHRKYCNQLKSFVETPSPAEPILRILCPVEVNSLKYHVQSATLCRGSFSTDSPRYVSTEQAHVGSAVQSAGFG